MRFSTPCCRAIRRYLLIFVAIALLPLALVYVVRLEQAYRIKGYEVSAPPKYIHAHISLALHTYIHMYVGMFL